MNSLSKLIIPLILITTLFIFYVINKKNSPTVQHTKTENKINTQTTSSNKSQDEKLKENKTLQLYENKTYKYKFKYAPNFVVRDNSSDENIILSDSPTGHWLNQISVSSNSNKLTLDQAFNQAIESLNKNKNDLIINDMFIGYKHAKRYSIKNPNDYGNTGIIFIHENNIFTIYGDDSNEKNKINLGFITSSFDLINSSREDFLKNSPYFIDPTGIYYINQFNTLDKLKDIDQKTFKFIGSCNGAEMYYSHYSRDKNHVYINGNVAENIDVSSFKYFGLFHNYDGMPRGVAIAKDKKNIYYGCGNAIDSIKKESFKVLDYGYAKDSQKIYYLDYNLKIADRKSFEILGVHKIGNMEGPFALDKNNVYFEGQIIKNISSKDCVTRGLEKCLPDNWHDLLDIDEASLTHLYYNK
jgi:hypothetical protein